MWRNKAGNTIMGRRKGNSWSVVALAVEAASLAVWMAVSSSPGWKELSLLLLGLFLSWLTLQSSGGHPNQRELWGWALQLHRCCMAHTFPPADRVSSSDALPAYARVCWLLLVKTGVINVSVVALATHRTTSWMLSLAQQTVSALLLAKVAPAVAAAAVACPALSAFVQQATQVLLFALAANSKPLEADSSAVLLCLCFILTVASVLIIGWPCAYTAGISAGDRRSDALLCQAALGALDCAEPALATAWPARSGSKLGPVLAALLAAGRPVAVAFGLAVLVPELATSLRSLAG